MLNNFNKKEGIPTNEPQPKEKEVIKNSIESKNNPSQLLADSYIKELRERYESLKEEEGDTEMKMKDMNELIQKLAILQESDNLNNKKIPENETQNKGLDKKTELKDLEQSVFKKYLEKKYDSLKSKFSKIIKPIKYQAIAMMFLMTPAVAQGQAEKELTNDKNKLEDTRGISKESKTSKEKTFVVGGNHRFTKINAEGDTIFNVGGIIAPVAVEFGPDKTTTQKETLNIPLTYAPDFENTNLTNAEDSTKMIEHFESEIRKNLANVLYRIFESEGVYNAHHEGPENLLKNINAETKINSITIVGLASPEATGAESIKPGNIEEKNENLAKKRAEITLGIVKKILEENKIDSSVIESINYEEVQFSDSEMSKLLSLAETLGIKGLAPEDQIIELIVKYNDGQYNENQEVKNTLDEIVGNKRGAAIDIEFSTTQKTRVVIPIPLLMLLLLSKRIRRGLNPLNWRKARDEDPTPTLPKEENISDVNKGPREIFSEKDINKENMREGEFNYYELYETSDKEIKKIDKDLIRGYFLRDELYSYLDDETSIERGLDYRGLINYILSIRSRYNTEEEIRVETSLALLEMWERYDRNVRKEAGIGINENTTLDYRHDQKKILWAKIAAPEILNLAKKYLNPEDMLIELQKLIAEFEESKNQYREDDPSSVLAKEESIKKPNISKNIEKAEKIDSTPVFISTNKEENKKINEISSLEYTGMVDDIKMLNERIQKSEGIITLEESDFKSEYGQKRYRDLKHISDGKPVTFNRSELQTIGDEIERILSNSRVVSEEELFNRKEKEKSEAKNKDDMKSDLEMINRKIQKSEGIITLEESDFKSEYGRQRYLELKNIAGGKPVSFNKSELQTIGDEIEGKLSGSRETKEKATLPVSEKIAPSFEEEKLPTLEEEIISPEEDTSSSEQESKVSFIKEESQENILEEEVFNVEELFKKGTEFENRDLNFKVIGPGGLFGNKIKIEMIDKVSGEKREMNISKKEIRENFTNKAIKITNKV